MTWQRWQGGSSWSSPSSWREQNGWGEHSSWSEESCWSQENGWSKQNGWGEQSGWTEESWHGQGSWNGQKSSGLKRKRASGDQRILVILDMNGVLLNRAGKAKGDATLRPHLDVLLQTLSELSGTLQPAVWSSMLARNLHPLVDLAFGERAEDLAFVFDQEWCTTRRVPGMGKPLLRKDLEWLSTTEWADLLPDRVLLVDDDPIKCTKNPEGSAVHPSSFEPEEDKEDTELLRLSGYLRALAASGSSVPDFVLSKPYEEFSDVPPPEPLVREPAKRVRVAAPRDDNTAGVAKRARVATSGDDGAAAGPKAAQAVHAFWPDSDEWLPAKVLKKLPDGSYRISWAEDNSQSVVPADYVSWPET